MVPSRLALARTFPSGEKATASTEPLCPSRVRWTFSGPSPQSGATGSVIRGRKAQSTPRLVITSLPSLDPLLQPRPRLGLHLGVELVRRLVQPGAQALRNARLLVAGRQLVETGPHPVQ